jgi:hypothetical protein
MIYQIDTNYEIIFAFDNANLSYSVTFNKPMPKSVISSVTETVKINELECYIIDMLDVNETQIYFERNNNLYTISYTNKQDLIDIIENLKELK